MIGANDMCLQNLNHIKIKTILIYLCFVYQGDPIEDVHRCLENACREAVNMHRAPSLLKRRKYVAQDQFEVPKH